MRTCPTQTDVLGAVQRVAQQFSVRTVAFILFWMLLVSPNGVVGADLTLGVFRWRALPPLPQRVGLTGSFAGVSHDALLVAGGAGYLHAPPWPGGATQWYDTIFVLDDAKPKCPLGQMIRAERIRFPFFDRPGTLPGRPLCGARCQT